MSRVSSAQIDTRARRFEVRDFSRLVILMFGRVRVADSSEREGFIASEGERRRSEMRERGTRRELAEGTAGVDEGSGAATSSAEAATTRAGERG
ncbi:hypothetical protein Scep_011502 [Stephania cephalantha]|uniref:Uncharacterized protein n=1 Tax=Stephania cephalantha TaxID=152367 RepID=A0AAP0JDH1_9MAGN